MKITFLVLLTQFLSVLLVGQEKSADVPDSSTLLAVSAHTSEAYAQDTTKKRPAEFTGADTPPNVIYRVEPKYPELALRAGMEGIVWVKVWIDSVGAVRDVVVLKSDADIFNKSAIEAARQFRFAPARIGTKPVESLVSFPFKFALYEKPDTTGKRGSWKSPAEEKFFGTITTLLEGGKVPAETLKVLFTLHATAIAGGYLKPLVNVIGEQNAGKHSLDEAGRKVVFTTSQAIEGSGISYMVFRTEAGGKMGKPHYHTIVFNRAADGTPQIIHWHAWHASR